MKAKPVMQLLNEDWHERALRLYLLIVIAHWAEHLLQAFQIFVLGWARPEAGGALGLVFPWLVKSEWLHYGYAIVMLIGLIVLRPGFQPGGKDRLWWNIALGIQFWHHFEHLLLFCQVFFGFTLFDKPVATSIAQLFFPRVELHLFYNVAVFAPMVVAMYYHLVPPAGQKMMCSCSHYIMQRDPGSWLPRYIKQPKAKPEITLNMREAI